MTIGIFDSGLGGLTVLKELERVFPTAQFLYFGDTAHLPYGTKSPNAVRSFLESGAQFLSSVQPLDALVIACATASCVFLKSERGWQYDLAQKMNTKIVDALTPAFEWIQKNVDTGRTIGFVGTPATIASDIAVRSLPGYAVLSKACPLLVPLIEEGWIEHPVTDAVLHEYFAPFIRQGVSHLVLGCTHYPILTPQISVIMGKETRLLDLGVILAEHIKNSLRPTAYSLQQDKGSSRFFVTDQPYRFAELSSMILGREIEAELVQLP